LTLFAVTIQSYQGSISEAHRIFQNNFYSDNKLNTKRINELYKMFKTTFSLALSQTDHYRPPPLYAPKKIVPTTRSSVS